MRARFMTYNILVGGRGRGSGDRRDSIAEVVGTLRPDVLAIQECVGFDADGGAGLDWLKHASGLDGTLVIARSEGHIALLWPRDWRLLEREDWSGELGHAGARLTLATAGGSRVQVAGVHLHPWSEDERRAEAEAIARRISRPRQLVLMGDLNALFASDPYSDADVARFLAQYLAPPTETGPESSRIRPPAHGPARGGAGSAGSVGRWRHEATDRLAASGLIDALRAARPPDHEPTWPTPAFPDPEGSPPIRIDAILISTDLAGSVRQAFVHTRPPADTASDHYPVVTDLDLPDADASGGTD